MAAAAAAWGAQGETGVGVAVAVQAAAVDSATWPPVAPPAQMAARGFSLARGRAAAHLTLERAVAIAAAAARAVRLVQAGRLGAAAGSPEAVPVGPSAAPAESGVAVVERSAPTRRRAAADSAAAAVGPLGRSARPAAAASAGVVAALLAARPLSSAASLGAAVPRR